jgi:lipopolysaccharide export system protein LptA
MQLDCLGAVRFRRGDKEKATGDTARYRRDGQTVVLKGNAEVTRGHTRLAGDRVVFLLDRDEVRVEGSARGSWAGGGD